jgi:hypothetical protein
MHFVGCVGQLCLTEEDKYVLTSLLPGWLCMLNSASKLALTLRAHLLHRYMAVSITWVMDQTKNSCPFLLLTDNTRSNLMGASTCYR